MQQQVSNEWSPTVAALDFCSYRRQTSEQQHSGWSPTEYQWNGLNYPPWLDLSKSTSHTEGKSQNPTELSWAEPGQEIRGCIVMEVKGIEMGFFQDFLVQLLFKEAEDSEGFIV